MTQVTEVLASDFTEEVENYTGQVLVDFYAQWCGPCKMIAPIIEQIAHENNALKVVKVDADEAQALMAKYGIRGIPTLLLFNNGEVVGAKVGAASLSQVKDFIVQ
ncbi:thioredoxin [Colwelliaceae bacterium 6471]